MFVACYYTRLYDKIAILYKILGEIKIFFFRGFFVVLRSLSQNEVFGRKTRVEFMQTSNAKIYAQLHQQTMMKQ